MEVRCEFISLCIPLHQLLCPKQLPSCTAVKPGLLTHLMNTTLPQGSTRTFACAAVADPFPRFTFRFNGERVTSNTSERTLVTNNTHGVLTLFNLQGTDEGTYECSVSNRYGSVRTAAVLTVQGVLWLCVPTCNVWHVLC